MTAAAVDRHAFSYDLTWSTSDDAGRYVLPVVAVRGSGPARRRVRPRHLAVGFLRSPLADVAEALRTWRAEIHGSAAVEQVPEGLSSLSRLEPLTGDVRPRELLVTCADPAWTAVFDCGVQSGDQTTTVGHLARTTLVQAAVVLSPTARPRRGWWSGSVGL